MLIEELVEEPPKVTGEAGGKGIEKPLTPEEIWERLDRESKMIASAIAMHGISITVPFLENIVGEYLEKYYLKDDPKIETEGIEEIITETVKKDLTKLIGSGVVEWTTPRKTDQEIYEQGKEKYSNSDKSGQLNTPSTYSDEVQKNVFQVAKKSLEGNKGEPSYNEQYVSINKSFKQLALAHSKFIKPQ